MATTQTWVYDAGQWRDADLAERIELTGPGMILSVEDGEMAWLDYRPKAEGGSGPAFVGGSELSTFRAGREADDADREAAALAHWATLAGTGTPAAGDIRPLLFQEGDERRGGDVLPELQKLLAVLGLPELPRR